MRDRAPGFSAYLATERITQENAGGSACVRAAAREGVVERELTVSCGLRVPHTQSGVGDGR